MSKKQLEPNALETLIARRQTCDQGVGEAIAAYHAAPPLSLQRRRVAKQLAEWDAKKYRITVELEDADPDWRAANLSHYLARVAHAWYWSEGLTVPDFALPHKQKSEQAALFAA